MSQVIPFRAKENATQMIWKQNRALPGQRVDYRDFDTLPLPVARYLEFAITDGSPVIRTGRISQQGEFRVGTWFPFKAQQSFSSDPPTFVWNATIRMAKVFPMSVRDSYRAGQGSMQGKMLGLPVMRQSNTPELNVAALQRYLAEAVWFPSVFLPGGPVRWTEIGDNRAVATISDAGVEASLEFDFNEKGEVTSVYSPGRFRYVGGIYVRTPWLGRFQNYRKINGVGIPTDCEVEWELPKDRQPYFRASITGVEYDGVAVDVFPKITCACG